jgi:hypothetical protein
MTDERKQEPLTEDELAQANGEPLPDREQMTVIRGADPLPPPINPDLTAADYSIDPVPTDVE